MKTSAEIFAEGYAIPLAGAWIDVGIYRFRNEEIYVPISAVNNVTVDGWPCMPIDDVRLAGA